MRIAEPAIVLTDYVIALECVIFAIRVWRCRTFVSQFWSIGFGAIALAALAGGTFHGIKAQLVWQAQLMVWQLTLLSLIIASFAIGLGAVAQLKGKQRQIIWAIALSTKALIVGILASAKLDFAYAMVDYGLTLGLVLSLQLVQPNLNSLRWLLVGVSISGLAGWLLIARVAVNPSFPPEALFHIVQSVGLYCLYRGAVALSATSLDKQKSPASARD